MTTPLETVCAAPPVRVPLLGFVPIASVTFVELSVVTTLLFASSSCTVTAGVMVWPATVLLGCTPNLRCVAVPGTTLKLTGFELVKPGPLSVALAPRVIEPT